MCVDRDATAPPFPVSDAVRAGLDAPGREAFRSSGFYRTHGAAFEGWLGAIRRGEPSAPADAAADDRLRLVHWNVEQGKGWERIVEAIGTEPRLRDADLWTLNEVDIGMARSGNRDVARALADRLGFHRVFAANYFEMTKGPGADALAPGENAVGLHGSALLSRWPLVDPGSGELPDCFDYFHFPDEKRYGHRRVLWATVRHPRGEFLLATAHLEVRNDPACRARQMAAALAALPEGPCWLAGDWNTHTFRRGSFLRVAREFLRLQLTSSGEIDRQLVEPWDREPLLRLVEQDGFCFRDWNDRSPTVREVLSGVEELFLLPKGVRRRMTRRLDLGRRTLRMRLDWIAARGPWAPAAGEGVWTGTGLGPDGSGASDHAPIGVEAVWSA